MKYFLLLFLFFCYENIFAQNVFNSVIVEDYTTKDTHTAVEYLTKKLNPKFPKDTQVSIENVRISGEKFIIISYYYTEFDGATRGDSRYFISFWKDNKQSLTCIGSNILNVYDPVITISNDIINIKAYKLYEPYAIYYYSFKYDNNFIHFNSIMKTTTDADNNANIIYYFSEKDTPVNINSILADDLINKKILDN